MGVDVLFVVLDPRRAETRTPDQRVPTPQTGTGMALAAGDARFLLSVEGVLIVDGELADLGPTPVGLRKHAANRVGGRAGGVGL